MRELIDPNSGEWCYVCLNNTFVVEDIERILKNKPNLQKRDIHVWSFNIYIHYSVKSGY